MLHQLTVTVKSPTKIHPKNVQKNVTLKLIIKGMVLGEGFLHNKPSSGVDKDIYVTECTVYMFWAMIL